MHTTVEIAVESLCQHGCKAVWRYISELEAGRTLPDTLSLNDVQRRQVLIELKEIMAVYGETSCTLDDAVATVEAKYSTGS